LAILAKILKNGEKPVKNDVVFLTNFVPKSLFSKEFWNQFVFFTVFPEPKKLFPCKFLQTYMVLPISWQNLQVFDDFSSSPGPRFSGVRWKVKGFLRPFSVDAENGKNWHF
jgi:hypothetical protein